MPQQIDVPGMGVVEFPDGMNNAAITAAIKQNMPPQKVTLGDIGASAWNDIKKAGSGIANSIYSGATLAGDVASGKAQLPSSQGIPGSVPFGDPNSSGERVADMAFMGSPMSAAARAGEAVIPGAANALRPVKVNPPTAEMLKASGGQRINSAREMGVEFSADGVKNAASGVRAGLEQDGVLGELAPKTFSILQKLENPPEGAFATLAGVEAARRSLGHAAKDFTNPTERMAASRAIDGLDSFLSKPPAEAVLAGPAADAGKLLEKGRADYAAAQRSNKLTGELDNAYTGVLDRAELGAATANSGHNVDNAIRQRAKSLLQNRKELNGFSPEEIDGLETVARGSLASNSARHIANLLGGGGGMYQGIVGASGAAAGFAMGGPLGSAIGGIAAPLVGAGLKETSSALTQRQARLLDEAVRSRSPLFREMQNEAGMTSAPDAQRTAFARALLLSQRQPQQ